MVAKPIKTLELHYPMIDLAIERYWSENVNRLLDTALLCLTYIDGNEWIKHGRTTQIKKRCVIDIFKTFTLFKNWHSILSKSSVTASLIPCNCFPESLILYNRIALCMV